MSLDQKITVDASGALNGVQVLNASIASIGESLDKLNTDLTKTQFAFNSLDKKLVSTLRTARDAALSLSRAANDATASVQKAVSGLASIDTAIEKRIDKVKDLRKELQELAGTVLVGGRQGGGGGNGGNRGIPGPGDGEDSIKRGIARLGDFTRFGEQLARQFAIIAQSRVFFFLKDSIEEAANAAKTLQERITEIQTISQAASRTSESWARSLIKVSNELGRPVVEVADAAYQTLSNNIRGAQNNTEAFVLTVGNFARVTRTSLPGAIDAVSSVLNSYGQTADQASEVTAKLFKGIELGRFRGEELASALGKVAPIASQLGISLDELIASFVVLTDQGQNLNTASTLVLNVLNALIKPSTDMKKLYTELGVSSGQSLTQQLKLAGVLELLGNKAKGATGELADLFTNIRGQRGTVGLTEDIRRFQNALEDIQSSKRSFDIALQIDQASQNREIDQFRNRLKNATITAFGQGLVTLEAGLATIDRKTGLSANLLNIASATVSGFLAVETSKFLFNLIQSRQVLQDITVLGPRLTNELQLSGKAALGLSAAFAAAYLVGKQLFDQSQAEVDAIELGNKRLRERSELARQINERRQTTAFSSVLEALTNIQRRTAATRREITSQFDAARDSVRTSFEQLQGSLSSTFERSRQAIQDINRDISRNLNEIDNSRKSLGDFRGNLEKTFLNIKIDIANPQQQLRILGDEIERLTNKGKGLIIKGGQTPGTQGEEFVREGRADLQEAVSLARQRAQVLQAIARENGTIISSTVLLNQLEDDTLRILNAKTQAENTFQQLKKQEVETLRLQKADEQERLGRLELVVKKYNEIQQKIAAGTIGNDKEFQRKGVFDPVAVEKELLSLSAKISDALFKIDPGASARFSADLAVNLRKSFDAINLTILDANAKNNEKLEIQAVEAAKKRQQSIAEVNAALQKSFTVQDDNGLAQASKLLSDAVTITTTFDNTFKAFLSGSKDEIKGRFLFIEQITEIRKQLDLIRGTQAGENGLIQLSPDKLAQLQAAQIAIERIRKALDTKTDLGRQISTNLDQTADDIRRTLDLTNSLNVLDRESNRVIQQIFRIETEGGNALDSSLKRLSAIAENGAERIAAALEVLEGKIRTSVNNIPFGGGFSYGGTVQGQGMDTMMAAVRAGETILSPGASRIFASQIRSAQNLASIPYGQSSNVNVGDVNVYVSGSSSPEQTVRQIGQGIRREIRRGTLRLG